MGLLGPVVSRVASDAADTTVPLADEGGTRDLSGA